MPQPNPFAGLSPEEVLDRLILAYEEQYQIVRGRRFQELETAALATYRMREKKGFFGLRDDRLPTGFSEANEHVAFLIRDTPEEDLTEVVRQLVQDMREQLLDANKEHSYSLFSVVILASSCDKRTAGLLKKLKYRENYQYGWGMGRVALFDLTTGEVACNGDGKDLKRAVLERFAQKLEGRNP